MKVVLITIFYFSLFTIDIYFNKLFSLTREIKTTFNSSVFIKAREIKFIKKNHQLTKCKKNMYCLIDQKKIWGTDYLIPETQLISAVFYKENTKIELDTSGMYNPLITENSFTIFSYPKDPYYLIIGSFSDGVSSYKAVWFIENHHSTRLMIGSSELLLDSFQKLFPK